MTNINEAVLRHYGQPFQEILKLSDISRPGIPDERLNRFRRK